jgi:hypothetical protein
VRTKAEIISDYQGRVLLPAVALSLWREKAKPKQVYTPSQLSNLVERHFQYRPSESAIICAMLEGVEYKAWRVVGEKNPVPHIEILPRKLQIYVESWRYIEDSELYGLETVGAAHLAGSIERSTAKAKEDFAYNVSVGRDFKGDLGFDRLRDHMDFMFGLGDYRAKGRSKFSRKMANEIDWSKWGAIAGIAAIPIAVLLWWFSK